MLLLLASNTYRFLLACCLSALLIGCGGGAASKEPTKGEQNQSQGLATTPSSSSLSESNSSSSAPSNIVTISWTHPSTRENGQYLELDQIGGYEIRYKMSQDEQYIHIDVPGNRTLSFTLNTYQKNMDLQIAVYDTKGRYSEFTPISSD